MNRSPADRASPLATAFAVWLLLGVGGVHAQSGIYTCIDAQGRRISSDRPIPACSDRPQRELNSSGTTKRIVEPVLTATEREAKEARERKEAVERQRARERVQRDQVLVMRYPDAQVHEAARLEALAQSQTVVNAAQQRIADLIGERKKLDEEMEFYQRNPSSAPARLRRAIEENAQALEVPRRIIAGQQEERDRINARFDEEATHLKALWQASGAAAASATTGAPTSR